MSPLVRFSVVVISVYLLLLSSTLAAAPKQYTLTQLRVLSTAAGAYSVATAINDNGVAVGNDTIIDAANFNRPHYRNALTWSATGTPTALPLPTNSPYAGAIALNNNGLIVGQSDSNNSSGQPTRATIFQGATALQIPPTGASNFALATGVNDAGVVVGNDSTLPFKYVNGVKTLLSATSGSTAFSTVTEPTVLVSENGVIYATGRENFTGANRPYRLDSATSRTALYADTSRVGAAYDVNRAEILAGTAQSGTTAGPTAPALFQNGNITLLPTFGGPFGTAFSLNDQNVVVGSAGNSGFQNVAFRYADGAMADLNSLIVGATGWTLREAVSINNRGQIVGNGIFDNDNNSATPAIRAAFRLDPVRKAADSNYDNTVDFKDLVVLAQNYNKSGNGNVFFETGDFNLDLTIDFKDLVILAQNYSKPAAFAADYALALSTLPEPTVPAVMLAVGVRFFGRRRRE